MAIERISELTRVLRAPNPGPMTLDGTNSYLIGGSILVDPGPDDPEHARRLAASGPIALVLITHHHEDHTGGSAEVHRLTGAPVRAFDPEFCIAGDALVDGEIVRGGDVEVRVVATPGHTADSVCFELRSDAPSGSVLTGDTILGRGTTVLTEEAGALGAYLASLERLRGLGPARVLPAHGPTLPDLEAVCDRYLAHRLDRLQKVRTALDTLGPETTVEAVTELAYPEIAPDVRFAAELSVRAQLAYLHERKGDA